MGGGNLRRKEKTNGLVGVKLGASQSNLRKKEKTNGLVGVKTGGGGNL